MQSGDSRGFTYLALLVWLALGGWALAAWGSQWSAAAQRERERELLFRGAEIRLAVARYWAAQEPHELPPTPESLLVDARTVPPRYHLRRLYGDPYAPLDAPQGGWTWLSDPERGGLVGVASRQAPASPASAAGRTFVFGPPER